MHGNNDLFLNIEPKPFKYFIVAENILGIYRNFPTFSAPIKLIVIFRILTELSLVGYILLTSRGMSKDIALFLSNFHATVSFLVSWFCSRTYIEFVGYLSSNHIAYKNDTTYSTSIDKCIKIGFIIFVAYFITVSITMLLFIHNGVRFSMSSNSATSLVIFNKAYNHYRYHLEYAFLYLNLRTMSEQLKCITRDVKRVISIYEPRFEANLDENDAETLEELFEKWNTTYTNIKESSSLFNKVFGIQFTSLLFTFVVYYVTVIYEIVASGIADQKKELYKWIPISFTLFVCMLELIMVIRAAHQLQKNTNYLVLCLQRAARLKPDDTHTYKAIEKLVRNVKSRPISIKAFGSINIEMPLIPTCLTLVTSQTVIALQSNNVL